jgi:hypothetical protein
MRELVFTVQREVFRIVIRDKEVWYADRRIREFSKVFGEQNNSIRIIPPAENLVKRVTMSRNKFPKSILQMIELTREEKAKYDKCNTEDELAEEIILDCKRKLGAVFHKK